jgi:hypothetical protein
MRSSIKSVLNKRVILLALSVFIISKVLLFIFVPGGSHGGCAGCVLDGTGKSVCINECLQPPDTWVVILASYLVALIIVKLFNEFRPPANEINDSLEN